jgi:hypothetical protein
MNTITLILSYIGSAPALLLLTSILLLLINKEPAENGKQTIGDQEFSATVTLMLCLSAVLMWVAHRLYPTSSAAIGWWHLSWASVLLLLLTYSMKRHVSSVFSGILVFVPIGFAAVAALSFLNSKAVSGLLMVLGCAVHGMSAYRKAQDPKKQSPAQTAAATTEQLSATNGRTPVDPGVLELRLKSQEANEGADKYTRE